MVESVKGTGIQVQRNNIGKEKIGYNYKSRRDKKHNRKMKKSMPRNLLTYIWAIFRKNMIYKNHFSETEYLKSPITIKVTEPIVNKICPPSHWWGRTSRLDDCSGDSSRTIFLYNLFRRIKTKEAMLPPTHFIKPV